MNQYKRTKDQYVGLQSPCAEYLFMWWRHGMEPLSALPALCEGHRWIPLDWLIFLTKGQ